MNRKEVLHLQLNNMQFLLGRVRGMRRKTLNEIEVLRKQLGALEKTLEEHEQEIVFNEKQIAVLEEMLKETEQ